MNNDMYKPYSTYTPEEHARRIQANQEAIALTKQHFVDFYNQQRIEEEKRQAEFQARLDESIVPSLPTAEEHLAGMADVMKKFEKFLDMGVVKDNG